MVGDRELTSVETVQSCWTALYCYLYLWAGKALIPSVCQSLLSNILTWILRRVLCLQRELQCLPVTGPTGRVHRIYL